MAAVDGQCSKGTDVQRQAPLPIGNQILAQLVEQSCMERWVTGSSPVNLYIEKQKCLSPEHENELIHL